MIFASDLDQTLIYSQRSKGSDCAESMLIPVETKNGQTVSYIAVQALSLLQELSERAMFVPVTTRTIEQYQRIHLFQEQIKPKYAVTSNGGHILIDGVADPNWHDAIRRNLEHSCTPSDQVRRLFHEIATPDWVSAERFCDGLFYAFLIQRDRLPIAEMQGLAAELDALGWDTSVQGRKVYLVPRVVSKRDALVYLQELEGKTVRFASGDSLLDRCMLDVAEHAFVPRHGELYREHQGRSDQAPVVYRFTEGSGALAAVEILQAISDLLNGS
ncbi:hypothetical protein CIG75_02950 [Tumebacillus algifaecis]|uniref:Sucrose phosphatase-like domain-containing protein n=1 Tax=Tumebacillus algifaecis TaxID=1214604 RepID=A0A223CXF7_9BACL|nr:HAD family hydrolase [Tumebacillus algifaecis]ASS74040.1 hypothetical protein CIG75_02950 [Tumebacillus algifaecis]